jgi:hypothetical protein
MWWPSPWLVPRPDPPEDGRVVCGGPPRGSFLAPTLPKTGGWYVGGPPRGSFLAPTLPKTGG